MIPILAPTPRHDRRTIELVTASRVLAVPAEQLPTVLAGLRPGEHVDGPGGGRLVLDALFEAGATPGRWRATARLHGSGPRLVPWARVEVEITPWSRDAAEVHVRPLARAPHAWGVRRLRRYLALAPLATEALVRRLERCALDAAAGACRTPTLVRTCGPAPVGGRHDVRRPEAA